MFRRSRHLLSPESRFSERAARGLAMAALMVPCAATLILAQGGPPAALVVTSDVISRPINESVEILGAVWPRLDSLVASEIEGRVAERMVENGDRVKKGQGLIKLDPSRLDRDLEMALAEKAETEARLANASRQETRARALYEKKVLEARLLDQTVTERMVQEGRLGQIEARIALIREDIERTLIRAPFPGFVTEIHTEVGQWIGRGDPSVRLADLDTVEIRLDVPERYFPMLSRGSAVPITLDALPGVSLEGKIFSLVPQASRDAHTFPVTVRAANPGRKVGGGMLARVRLSLGSHEKALMVPKDAIVRQAQQTMIYLLEGDQVKLVPVSLGRTSGSLVEISGEVTADDQVVVRGNERLAPGMRVQVEEKLASGQ